MLNDNMIFLSCINMFLYFFFDVLDAHIIGNMSGDNRDGHHNFIERPRSSCEMPRVPGIQYVYLF